jgi:hypothetical protein
MPELTPEERQEVERTLSELREHGYVDIDHHGELRPGVRVRHRGHQWSEAIQRGTGNVVAITEKPNSAWSDTWRMADVEMVVVFDKPWPASSRLSQLAQYHVVRVEVADA